jgi:arylsulfatase A-like enzyme
METKGLWTSLAQQRRVRLRQGPLDVPRLDLDAHDDVDAFIATQAADAVKHLPTDKPWALLTVFTGPGNDLPAPRPYHELITPDELDCQFVPADLRALDALAQLDYPRVLLQRLDRSSLAVLLSDYLGRVALLDLGIGLIARAARQRPDADRTWILVTSDHGKLLGESGLLGHRSFMAPALEVPVLLAPLAAPASPDRDEPQRIDGLISTVDVAATIADIAACDLPSACVGHSLLPAVRGKPVATLASEVGCLSEFGRRLMLQNDRHKIILDVDTRQVIGIYDLLNDPLETRNLSETVLGKNLVDALRWRIGDALLSLRFPA